MKLLFRIATLVELLRKAPNSFPRMLLPATVILLDERTQTPQNPVAMLLPDTVILSELSIQTPPADWNISDFSLLSKSRMSLEWRTTIPKALYVAAFSMRPCVTLSNWMPRLSPVISDSM